MAVVSDPASPPPFDKVRSIKTIKYEYDMALATAIRVGRDWPEEEAAIQFALLESFLVHARNLHEFLRPRTQWSRKRPGDFWACDFTNGFGYAVFDQEIVNAVNRWLQHITTWRYEDDHARWHPLEMLVSIYKAMDAFLAKLAEDLARRLRGTHCQVGDALAKAGLLGD